jgi:hypothetical protein
VTTPAQPTAASVLLKLVAPVLIADAPDVEAFVAAKGAELSTAFAPIEDQGIVAVATDLENAVADQGLFEKMDHGQVVATMKNLATEIQTQVPAINSAAVALVVSVIESVAARAKAAEGGAA